MFIQNKKKVRLPTSVQSIAIGVMFIQSMMKLSLPASLQSLAIGVTFIQSMVKVSMPASLQSLAMGIMFVQSMVKVSLPASYLTLSGPNNYINYMRVCVCAIIHAYYAHITTPPSGGLFFGAALSQGPRFAKVIAIRAT